MKSNSKTFLFFVLLTLFCCNYNSAQAQPCGNNKVFICHNVITICVSVNAVPAHLAHGDFLGTCDSVPPPPQCNVDLGPDTSFCSNQGSLVLDAGPGFDSYLWSDNSTGQTLTVTVSGTYW